MFREAEEIGLRFECNGCRQCCCGGPGYVWLSKQDLSALSAGLGLNEQAFFATYCRRVRVQDGYVLSLNERTDYSCVFLCDSGCKIYKFRPVQCRTYPFWSEVLETSLTWSEEGNACPGIGTGRLYTPEEIYQSIVLRRVNPPLKFEIPVEFEIPAQPDGPDGEGNKSE